MHLRKKEYSKRSVWTIAATFAVLVGLVVVGRAAATVPLPVSVFGTGSCSGSTVSVSYTAYNNYTVNVDVSLTPKLGGATIAINGLVPKETPRVVSAVYNGWNNGATLVVNGSVMATDGASSSFTTTVQLTGNCPSPPTTTPTTAPTTSSPPSTYPTTSSSTTSASTTIAPTTTTVAPTTTTAVPTSTTAPPAQSTTTTRPTPTIPDVTAPPVTTTTVKPSPYIAPLPGPKPLNFTG